MFPLVRALVLLLLLGAAVCFGLYLVTRERRWLNRGLVVTKWTVIAGLAFFAVLIGERLLGGP